MERTSTAIRVVLQAIRARSEPAQVVAVVLEQACHLANAIHGSLVRVDRKTNKLIITSTYGPDWTEEKTGCLLSVGEGVTGMVAATGKPYLCTDVTKDPTYIVLFENVKSELTVPVIVRGEIWGLINLDGFEIGEFDEGDLTIMTLFAELVAFAFTLQEEFFERQRLHEEVMEGQKLSAVGKVIAGIAHEINNPLTTVVGQASLLAMTPNEPPDPASVQTILNESRRAARIIRTLLHFSRKETEGRRWVNVRELVGEIFELRQYQLRLNNITLRFQDAVPPAAILANPEQILQVLLNLLSNAEQAIDPLRRDGDILIRAEWVEEADGLWLSVTDNGRGVPEEASKRIFEPFFSTRDTGEASGLGLSVGHALMEAHGGSLFLRSSTPQGSCFILEFKECRPAEVVVPAKVEAVPAAAAAPEASAKRGRMLVVDDEPAILQFLTRFLGMLQVDVATAVDGQKGLERLAAEDFDIVLSDIKMPQIDGFEFYNRAMLQFPRYKDRFLFMSGDFISESAEEFHKKTGCEVLEKPFDLARLREMLLSRFAAQASAGVA